MRHIRVADSIIIVAKGDITADPSDCIVCPVNESMTLINDVSQALCYSGGKEVQQERERWLKKNKALGVGGIAVTRSGHLPCKQLIHAVAPIFIDGRSGEEKQLRVAVKGVLLKAEELNASSIAIPLISPFYPISEAARVYFEVTLEFLTCHQTSIAQIRFLNFDRPTVDGFIEEFDRRFSASINGQNFSFESVSRPVGPKSCNQVCCMLF